ncbi:hypothetical protein K461DRAFT_52168 [Myriangium duriaei CBS 260.36]|uniref:Uncharacterized protein n=1 Tax=Myriangium duriaei CBS 260.36 TaxID=1168546 RepID=A0A9P4IS84_9PEZI|nr:hypothetical protein K461DRAFT_52168 [Myriangium duriaei CBS 260.36]
MRQHVQCGLWSAAAVEAEQIRNHVTSTMASGLRCGVIKKPSPGVANIMRVFCVAWLDVRCMYSSSHIASRRRDCARESSTVGLASYAVQQQAVLACSLVLGGAAEWCPRWENSASKGRIRWQPRRHGGELMRYDSGGWCRRRWNPRS